MEEKEYPVWMNAKQIGFIRFKREGLYFIYNGRISPETDGIYRIYAMNNEERINLGVCQPIDSAWVTQGKIPAKQFDCSSTRFIVNPTQNESQNTYPIDPKARFAHLEELDRCYFFIWNDRPCIRIDCN